MPATTLVCATRRSALAMMQSRCVAARLAERGIATTILGVTTHGDRDRERRSTSSASVNVFVKELESALRERRADYAVHSCKDLAGALRRRHAHRRDLARAKIRATRSAASATPTSKRFPPAPSSARRARAGARSSPRCAPILRYETCAATSTRGCASSRRRVRRDRAGDGRVERLGLRATHVVPFARRTRSCRRSGKARSPSRRAPATIGSPTMLRAAVNDPQSELCVDCERAALRALRAGCSAPLGIHATSSKGRTMIVEGAYAPANGTSYAQAARAPRLDAGRGARRSASKWRHT